MEEWESKVVLKEGESLKFGRHVSQGFMQEEDVEYYSVVRADGTTCGSVKVTDHMAVRGFRRTISVHQTDSTGATVVSESWHP
ncbi:hypothetical protein WH50_16275 [Pokkaliibacter plantistimulans]|uniref:Hypervirulence associated protein TUDOR domain-containing protein n=1 Tax=Pokkaliibacter plantistimulans TaxID=1635171 RepID=A0ABX5LV88_9GAMM|nr:hypothetical protein [Pokkaliibacter plantistimulans]PXF30256.1 hypothetical protein WH50_16275 [Pokkaliibacter plantistimulans]